MRPGYRFLILATALLALCAAASAQDQTAEGPPIGVGAFDIQGSATAGYRFTDVKGYEPMFLELMDLQQGFRVMDFNMFGEAKEGTSPFADSFSVLANGLGGDPFATAQVNVTKNKLYDFRANWRQSYYYWNQNDNVILPLGFAGLTSNHDWQSVRKFGSADLTLHATNDLRFNFNYYRTTDSGPTFTTRAPDFFGSPGYWGSYARDNPYYLFAPINDETNRFTGGFDYTWHSWNFHYNLGYQTYNENLSLNNVDSPQRSINTSTAGTAAEPLLGLSWSQFRRLTTPVSEFSFTSKPFAKLEWRGEYIYYRYRGPATQDQSFNGIAPDSNSVLMPYAVSANARVNVTEPSHTFHTGFTYHAKDWWDVNLDYRYSRFTTDARGDYNSLFNGGSPASGTSDFVWRDGLSDLDFNMSFAPTATLVIRPGIHLMQANVLELEDGQADPARSLRINTVAPEISVGYEPSKIFEIRGDFHMFTNGASYTAITPHTQKGGHIVARLKPTAKLSVEDEMNLSNSRLIDTNFKNNIHSNAITVSYSLDERFSIFGGFSYNNYYAAGDIVYMRGTPPLLDFLTDQEINRVWSGGVEAKPAKHFGLRLSGNYDRATGMGVISGEPPAYGPLRWPLITGTVYFDFPKAGRLSIDLQRTYYIEEIVTGNNFSANMLTIRWTKNF
jgi:hypothetical protein